MRCKRSRRRPARSWDRARWPGGNNPAPCSIPSCVELGGVIAALQIELIRLRIFRLPLGHLRFLRVAQPEPQLARDLRHDILLHGQRVRQLSIVVFAPQLAVIVHIHQLRAHRKVVAALRDPARDHRAHAQLAPHGARVGFLALVAEHRAARHHFQVGQLGEAVDQALRDAVAQPIRVLAAAGVDERQNRQRVDVLARGFASKNSPAAGQNQHQRRAIAATTRPRPLTDRRRRASRSPAELEDSAAQTPDRAPSESRCAGFFARHRSITRSSSGRTGLAGIGHRGRIFLENRRHRVGGRFSSECAPAGHHLIQHAAERKDVAGVPAFSPRTCSGDM